jgi:hypothetical protein
MRQTTAELAEELRAIGSLDEEKWLALQKAESKKFRGLKIIGAFCFFAAVFYMNFIILIFMGGFAYYVIFVALRNSQKEWVILAHLFSYGEKSKAVIDCSTVFFRGGSYVVDKENTETVGWSDASLCSFKIRSSYSFENKGYTSTQNMPAHWVANERYPKSGEEIEIMYDKKNPSLFRYYNKKLNDLYCIRKAK